MKKIAGMTFEDFSKSIQKQEKIYQKNLRTGSKLKKKSVKGKFAWSTTAEGAVMKEYHRNVKTYDLAFNRMVKIHLKRMMAWWGVKQDELEIVGSSRFGEKNDWNNKVLTKDEIEKIVVSEGKIIFCMRYKGEDKEKAGCDQEWGSIYTMEALDREENDLKQQFQTTAQEEADRTGKKATIVNLIGWKFEAEPRKTDGK